MPSRFDQLVNDKFGGRKRKKPVSTLPDDPPQPNFETELGEITSNTTVDEVFYLSGHGCEQGGIMFVTPALFEEDAVRERVGDYGYPIKEEPSYMKCIAGQILKDILLEIGIPHEECRYTAVIKWLLPKLKRLNPDRKTLKWAEKSFIDEIKTVKPDIVVCLGKAVFNILCPVSYRADDVKVGWFYHEELNCRYILLDPAHLLSIRPDYVEKFRSNLLEVKNTYDALKGRPTRKIATDYLVIRNSQQLLEMVQLWKTEDRKLFSVDCEWAGNNFVDGKLRTIQFCWAPGKACVVRFMDDRMNYVFDIPYTEAGEILGEWLNQPKVKYIGHHWSADAPWMHSWLKLDIWGKCILDTEFALQTCNEHEDLSLERLAIRYTDMGRYDLALEIWKKTHKIGPEEGYGLVPDDILLDYSMGDVDVVMRVYPVIVKDLVVQQLWDYYEKIFNPFVTDVFTNFAIVGLPVDMDRLDDLRELFSYARQEMEVEFRELMVIESRNLVYQVCIELLGDEEGQQVAENYLDLPPEQSLHFLKTSLGLKNIDRANALHEHFLCAPKFNIRSGVHMRRWLFGVKNYTPAKSTNRKEKGMPSMDWAKVQNFPPEVRQNYLPAVDKSTLQLYAVGKKDNVVNQLLNLNAVGNLVKGFLKPTETDEDGEVVRENGLHFWVASDGRVHYNSSVTETARNRCWKPNILNWPSYVNDRILEGITNILKLRHEQGLLPKCLHKHLTESVPSIRSVVKAPPGWLICESDYATAEIRGLAFISGCPDLMRLVTEPDYSWGYWKEKPDVEVRLSYSENCGIDPREQDDKYILAVKKEGEWHKITEEDLVRDENGKIKNPPRTDLHWSFAERMKGLPRECLDKKIDRGGIGKRANFSCAYGVSPSSIERQLEVDIGIRPEEGTGQKIMDTLYDRQHRAMSWLDDQQEIPRHLPFTRLASGRKRRWLGTNSRGKMAPDAYEALMSSQGREARNTPLQESVASTSAIASTRLLKFAQENNLKGRPMVLLYDAVCTLCPEEEINVWALAHELFMYRSVVWQYGDRYLNYPIDVEYNRRWSTDTLTEEERKVIDTPRHLRNLEAALRASIEWYKENMEKAVCNTHKVK